MKKILKTLQMTMLLMAAPSVLDAQATFVVAEGTASPNVPPFYLFNAKYAQWSQSIYPASELTALNGQTLTAFTYHTGITTFTPDPGEWVIMLGITSNNDLTNGKDNTVCDTVFNGRPTFDAATGNMTFTFDSAFEYNGGNLLVWFDHPAGTTTAQHSCTWQAKVATNASRRAYNTQYTSQYNTAGSLAGYLPTLIVTVDGNGGCDPVAVTPTEPFEETFLDAWTQGKPGLCWADNSHVSGPGTYRWSKSYQGHDDLYGAKFQYTYSSSGTPARAHLVTPLLNIPAAGAYSVGLWMKRATYSTVYMDAGVRVFVNSTPDTVGATLLFFAPQHIMAPPAVSEAGWYYFEGTIPSAGDQYVIIQGVDQGIADICIDEFRVGAIPSCDHPSNMAWNGTQVTWTAGNASQWQVRDGEHTEVVNSPAYSNPNWLSATNYMVYVRSICGAGDTLEWRGPVSFTTPCDIITLGTADSLVFDFDNITTSGTLPACWTTRHISGPGTQLWGSYSATSAHSGNRVMRLPDMNATTITDLVSSQINIPAAGSHELRLWVKRGSGTKQLEGVKVWVNTTPDTLGGTPLFHAPRCISTAPVASEDGWYEFRGTIPLAGNLYVVLQGISEWGQETWVDDMVIAPVSQQQSQPSVSDSIRYWVGSGENAATLTLHFNNAPVPTSFVWGFRWDEDPYEEMTVAMMLDSVAEADSRVLFDGTDVGFLNSYTYNDGTYNLTAPTGTQFAGFIYNNTVANYGIGVQTLSDGDAVAFMDADYDFFMGDINLGVTDTVYVDAPGDTPVTPQPVSNVPFPLDSVHFWAGSGSNSAVVRMQWSTEDEYGDYYKPALVWGVRWNGAILANSLMDSLRIHDTRLSFTMSPSRNFIEDISYADPQSGYLFEDSGMGWMYKLNGQMAQAIGSQSVADGDFLDWSDMGWFSLDTQIFVRPVATPAPDPDPVDATIAFSDILYWVGSGTDSAAFIVSYAQPDTAFAWGFLFNGTTTAQAMLDSIAANDPRFSYTGSPSMGGDIYFVIDNGDTLSLSPVGALGYNFWWTNLNGISASAGLGSTLRNGDVFKFGDLNSAIGWDMQYGYYMEEAWITAPTPVTVPSTPEPQPEQGPFCGAVGTEGCNAIAADSSAIVAWATGCILDRGPQNIAVEGSPTVDHGTAADAIGPCSDNNTAVVSLGDGGSATLTFELPIRNGEGPDFAVFENSFGDMFLELAFVEVSSDGEHFVRFPATSLTQTTTQVLSTGSTDPTFINNLAGKFRHGYGTPFDLEELRDSTGINLDSITHVRIVDVVGSIDPRYATYDAFGHIVNDPWPTSFPTGGFDLSGVAVIHQADPPVQGIEAAGDVLTTVWPNPTADVLHVTASRQLDAVLYDLTGRPVAAYTLQPGQNNFSLRHLPAGVYMLRADEAVVKVVKR